MKYVYFVVEGQHDAAAIGKLLKINGYEYITKIDRVDFFWLKTIPNKFPYKGDLFKRVPIPHFYQNNECSVAIHPAGGESNILSTLNGTIANIEVEELAAIGIFCDSDKKSPQEKGEFIISELQKIEDHYLLQQINSIKIGQVQGNELKIGIYVFPNNGSNGTLENLLLQCAEISYSNLFNHANMYIKSIDHVYKQSWKPFEDKKVLVGCIANVLKPGKANQVSIQDDEWFSNDTLNLPDIKKLNQFILELIT